MDFNNNKAIYEQMADRMCDEIIAGNYRADDRIPSVREYAIGGEHQHSRKGIRTACSRRYNIQQTRLRLLRGTRCSPPDTGTTQKRICERTVARSVQANVVVRN